MDAQPPKPTPRPQYTNGQFSFRSTGIGLSRFSDVYPTLLTTSWPGFLFLLLAGYTLTNGLFAALYLAGGDCFNAPDPGNALQAFSFAVQTLSGIGYGAMHPTTPYAYMVSDIQAFVGLVGLALATGLMFARFSRPTSRISFSDNLLVRHRNGRPHLTFRMANERANQLVEATVSVVALIEEETAEGERMRRLVDLDLLRGSSPLFSMSWTVLHELSDDSPLASLRWGEVPDDLWAVIVNVMGVDSTMNQTVHKQHFYDATSILCGQSFVDMVENHEDGSLTLHYGRLHQIQPDAVEQALIDAARAAREAAG